MKNKIDCPILLLALLVSAVLLTSCKIMMPSDYRRAKEIVTSWESHYQSFGLDPFRNSYL